MAHHHITYQEYEEHRKHSINNKQLVERSNKVACFYCYKYFDAKEIDEYTNDETAICPHCGVDVVITDASGLPIHDPLFLKHMHFYGFDHIVQLNDKLTVRKHHAAQECPRCCLVNYLDHLNEVIPARPLVLKELKSLGGPCPWQWEGVSTVGEEVYIRERCDVLRVDVGDVVYLLIKDLDNFNGFRDLKMLTGTYITYPDGAGDDEIEYGTGVPPNTPTEI